MNIEPRDEVNLEINKRNKAIVRKIIQAYNNREIELLEGLVDPRFTYNSAHPEVWDTGINGIGKSIEAFRESFPDFELVENGMVAEGDMVICNVKFKGNQTGPLFGRKPSGDKISVDLVFQVRIRDGSLAELKENMNLHQLLYRLGLYDDLMASHLNILLRKQTESLNKSVVRRITRAFNLADPELVDGMVDPKILDLSQKNIGEGKMQGFDGVKKQVSTFNKQFSDLRFEEVLMVAEDDMVVLRWKMTGTNTGKIFGREPTGRKIIQHGAEFVRLEDGRIVEHSDSANPLEFLDKLGLLDDKMMNKLAEVGVRKYDSN